MSDPSAITFAAAVLAGGRSVRMGRDKAGLVWQGERLLDRQIRLVTALAPRQRFVSARPDSNAGPPGIEVVVDRHEGRGPLGALEALMARMETTHLLVVAVDMPCLTVEVLEALCAQCAPDTGVVPVLAGHLEPLAAVYPACCARRLPGLLRSGRGAMRDLIKPSVAAGELLLWSVPDQWTPQFANWNRPEDLPSPDLPA